MTRNLSDEDIKTLAKELAQEVRRTHHDFWIDGEVHYNAHKVLEPLDHETVSAIRELAYDYKTARRWSLRGFLVMIALVAAIVLGTHYPPHTWKW